MTDELTGQISRAFSPLLSTEQIRSLPPRAGEDPLETRDGYALIQHALDGAMASGPRRTTSLNYNATIRWLRRAVASVDAVHHFTSSLLASERVDDFVGPRESPASRLVLWEILNSLPPGRARKLLSEVTNALDELRPALNDAPAKMLNWRTKKRPGTYWGHLEELVHSVHEILDRNGIALGFRNSETATRADTKTSNLGPIIFELTKLLPDRTLRPNTVETVEGLYRKIRPDLPVAQRKKTLRAKRK